eukprot:tig00021319_g20200.t1
MQAAPVLFLAGSAAIAWLLYKQRRRDLAATMGNNQPQAAPRPTPTTQASVPSQRPSSGRRRLALSANAIFDITEPDAGPSVTPRPDAGTVLNALASKYELYVIGRVSLDKTEELVREAVKATGAFDKGLHPARVLFCSTVAGRASICRQIEPQVCVDDEASVLTALKPHVGQLVHILRPGAASSSSAPASALPIPSESIASLGEML